jgi:hypothetical protein
MDNSILTSNGISSVQFTLTATPIQPGYEGSANSYPLSQTGENEIPQDRILQLAGDSGTTTHDG